VNMAEPCTWQRGEGKRGEGWNLVGIV